MPNDVAETMPGGSNCAAQLLTAALLYVNSLPESPHNWVRINPNHNYYYSDIMEIGSAL
jgi:hypothetical protein